QKKNNAGTLSPFLFSARNGLVDDCLRAIGEVAELGLPQYESVCALYRVAILEPECGIFAEKRIVNPQSGLRFREVSQRQPFLPICAIVQYRVALNEGSTACVLTSHAYRSALEQHR